jgi:peptidoglycan/xylan/chitin deacetylase (PgdA/CDA1 family)
MHVAPRLSKMPFDQRRAQLAALRGTSRPSTTSLPLLDWNELNDISRDGFEVGAHTVNHPHLSRVSPEVQFQEIQESVECLTMRLGTRPAAFAYPHGDIDKTVEETARRIGFEAAYAAHPGTATPGKTNPFRVPRIQLEAKDPTTLEVLIVIIKLGKYFPALVGRILSKFFATQYEA